MIVLRLKHLAFERSSAGMPVQQKCWTLLAVNRQLSCDWLKQYQQWSKIFIALAFRQTIVRKLDVLTLKLSFQFFLVTKAESLQLITLDLFAKARCFRVQIFCFYFSNSVCGRRPWKFIKNGTNYSGKYENGSDPNHLIESNQAVRPRSGRIIQGIKADYGEWPWQISIRKWIKGIHLLNGNSLIFTNIFHH